MAEYTGDVMIGVWVEPDLKAELEKLAREADRTLSAEVRRALRVWVLDQANGKGQE